jgi:phosphomevalonate kinase
LLAYQRAPGRTPLVRKVSCPAGLALRVFWTGSSASTPALIQGVRALAARAPAVYSSLIDDMRHTADEFVHSFLNNDARGAIGHADQYGRLLEKLGTVAGVPIVTAPFVAAAALARSLGGAAKPSGAGGGDVGVALFDDDVAATEFERRCPAGVSVLDVSIDLQGAHRRHPEMVELI